jgi:acyl carrier protein
VLDPRGALVPVGVAGELHIAGAGLSPGYWGKPGLTADRFIPNPFAASPDDGLHLYRTGDLARWREDGMLDFLGRLDNQIKLRGFRIEPGEIEARLCAHPLVAEAVVLVEDREAGQQLVAYLRWRDAVSGNPAMLLRDHVAETLPSYMIPTVYVPLERFPLTPNGKVDRKLLKGQRPTLVPDGGEAPPVFGEPASTLAAIWREVLKAEHIGLKDNFFELGGHSLLVITLQSAIRERLDLTLDITDFFRFPTLETLAARITPLTGTADGEADEQHDRAAPRRAGRERLAQRRSLRAPQITA